MLTKKVVSPVTPTEWVGLQALGLASIALRAVDHRGTFAVASQLRRLGAGDEILVQMHKHVRMYLSWDDPYWLQFMALGREYEPEIRLLLERFAERRCVFADCGANYGYWSIMANKRFGWPTIAIEAAAQTAEKLRRNLELNDCTVDVLEAAISDQDGGVVRFAYEARYHAGARVTDSGGYLVPTATIDSVIEGSSPHDLAIVKIDVEGQEQAALNGARRTLQGPSVVVYEEHGNQKKCEVTERLIDEGFAVYFLAGTEFVRIKSGHDAHRHMSRSAVGYNFVATRTGWVMEALTTPGRSS